MKKIVIASLILGSVGAVHAQGVAEGYAVTADLAYASQYVFRGIRHANDSVQPSVEFGFENAYAGIWSNQPLQSHRTGEVDAYAGYKYSVTKTWSFEVVGSCYDYPGATGGRVGFSYEMGLGATYLVRGVSASIYYYRDFKLDANTEQGSLAYSIPLKAIGGSIDCTVYVGTVQSDDGLAISIQRTRQSYNYYGVDLTLPYKLSEKTSMAAGVHWADRDGWTAPDGNNHLWFTVSLTHAF